MINKKGQGMSTSTIILLVLGLIVLGILAFGFMSGWEAFKAETGKTNVDQIAEECSVSCSINEKYSFCNTGKEIRLQDEDLKYKTSCGVYATVDEFKKFNVDECSRIECVVPCVDVKINDETGEKTTESKKGYHDVSAFASDLAEGEFCLIVRK